MKKISLLFCLLFALTIKPLSITPIYYTGEPWPVFCVGDWPDVIAFFECYGDGNLNKKTKITEGGKLYEKWIYGSNSFDCGSEGGVWMTVDTFTAEKPGLYTVEFVYIADGVTKSHSTRVRFIDCAETDTID